MEFLGYKFYSEPLSVWFVSFAYIIGAFVIGQLILRLNRKVLKKWADKSSTVWDNIVLDMFETPLIFGINLFGIWLALEQLHFSPHFDVFITKVYRLLAVLNITWFVSRLLKSIINELITNKIAKNNRTLDKHIAITVQKIFVAVIWFIGAFIAMKDVGINVKALIAGLGIGGIAFALAAQDTLKNILGGLTLFVDQPFRIGDRIKVDVYDGSIEDIGIRSVRLRTQENRLITIPNSKIADGAIENITQEPSTRVTVTLKLPYDSTLEKMSLALQLLKELPKDIPNILPDATASFTDYADFSMNISFVYFVRKRKPYNDTVSAVNLEILRLFNSNGISFATSGQTTVNLQK